MEADKLSTDYKTTLYLDKDLDDEAWRPFYEALSKARQEDDGPIRVIFCGQGGNSDATDALYDIIANDGNIDGYLLGCAYSGHSHVFAACRNRFVYPSSYLGIHEARWSIYADNEVDAAWLEQRLNRVRDLNMRQALRYAKVSNKSIEWWLEQLHAAGYGYTIITACQMVKELAMAEYATQ